jgi:hypothetical protein
MRSSLSTEIESDAFVGAFLHPNCHSVYASLFFVFLASTFLLGTFPRRRIALPMMAIWGVFMIWSKARASVAATIVGTLVLLVLAQPFRNRFGWRMRLNVSRTQIAAVLVIFVIAVGLSDLATGGGVSRAVIAFINKAGTDSELTELDAEQVLASRQGLIDLSWSNFQDHPMTGIGFQVGTSDAFIKKCHMVPCTVR